MVAPQEQRRAVAERIASFGLRVPRPPPSDDLLATGGTAAAALDLIHQLGGRVLGSVFFIELAFLNGREKLAGKGPVHALLTY